MRYDSFACSCSLPLCFTSPLFAAVEKGPYMIYDGNVGQMTVLWQLDQARDCTIRWGTDTRYRTGSADTSEHTDDHLHRYTIKGLRDNTGYYYKVDGVGRGSFRTAPGDSVTAVKLLAYGDTRGNKVDKTRHDGVAAEMMATIGRDQDYQTIALHAGI